MKDKDLEATVHIYTGPIALVKGLISRLNDLGINPIERTDNDNSIQKGFTVSGAGEIMLFLRKDELVTAQPVIDAYLREIEE